MPKVVTALDLVDTFLPTVHDNDASHQDNFYNHNSDHTMMSATLTPLSYTVGGVSALKFITGLYSPTDKYIIFTETAFICILPLTSEGDNDSKAWKIPCGANVYSFDISLEDCSSSIYCGFADGSIVAFDIPKTLNDATVFREDSGEAIFSYTAHSDVVEALICSSGHIFSGSWDGSVVMFSLAARALVSVFRGHEGYVHCLAIVETSYGVASKAISGGADHRIITWNLETYDSELIQTETHRQGVTDLHIPKEICDERESKHNLWSASFDCTVVCSNWCSGEILCRLHMPDVILIRDCTFSNTTTTKTTSRSMDSERSPLTIFIDTKAVLCVTTVPSVGDSEKRVLCGTGNRICEFDSRQGHCIGIYEGHVGRVEKLTTDTTNPLIFYSAGMDSIIGQWTRYDLRDNFSDIKIDSLEENMEPLLERNYGSPYNHETSSDSMNVDIVSASSTTITHEKTRLLDLPTEILHHILSFLPFSAIGVATQVCFLLHTIIETERKTRGAFWFNLDFHSVGITVDDMLLNATLEYVGDHPHSMILRDSSISDASIFAISSMCTNLQSISLANCSQIEAAGLLKLAQLVNLTELDVSGCWNMNDDIMVTIVSAIPNLRLINISSCFDMSSKGVSYLQISLNKLEDLQLRNLSGITSEAFSMLGSRSIVSCIAILDLSQCSHVNNDVVRNISQLYQHSLTSLYLQDCSNVDDEGIQVLTGLCIHLILLDISGCYLVTDRICHYAHNCPHLVTLSLSFCVSISDVGILSLIGCTSLKRLHVENCCGITKSAIIQLREQYDIYVIW